MRALTGMRGAIVTAAAVGALATGCASAAKSPEAGTAGAPSAAPGTPDATPSSGGSDGDDPDGDGKPDSADSPGVQLTGAQLSALLAPDSFMPAGFTRDARKSGHSPAGGQKQSTATVAHPDCALLGTDGWEDLVGTGTASADAVYAGQDGAFLMEGVDRYADEADARKVAANFRVLAQACPGYADPSTKDQTVVRESALSGLGDLADVVTIDSSQWTGGYTLELVQVGPEVVGIEVAAPADRDRGAAEASKLVSFVVGQVKSAT